MCICIYLIILHISYKWHFILCELLCLLSLDILLLKSICIVRCVNTLFTMSNNNIPLHGYTTFIYPFISSCKFELFLLLTINATVYENVFQIYFLILYIHFHPLFKILLLRHMVTLFKLLRNCQIIFQVAATILQSLHNI